MNNLIGVSGQLKAGKDLVGEMLQYIGDEITGEPTFERYQEYIRPHKYKVERVKRYKIKKFANKLKECVGLILGCTVEQLEDREFKNKELGQEWWIYHLSDKDIKPYGYFTDPDDKKIADERFLVKHTPRTILQLLGTEGGRKVIHPNIWVNALFADYKFLPAKGKVLDMKINGYVPLKGRLPSWIITDVRFPSNEGKAVLDRNGLMIGIRRHWELRFPEYAALSEQFDPYAIPIALQEINPDLYKSLTHDSEALMGDHSWCDFVIENNGTKEELFNNVLKAVRLVKEEV